MVILKLILVIMLLVAMVVILLGIGHLGSGRFETTAEDVDKLRHEVDSSEEVISRRNAFHEFLPASKTKVHR